MDGGGVGDEIQSFGSNQGDAHSAAETSARAKSLYLLKKKLGSSAMRKSRGQPLPPPPPQSSPHPDMQQNEVEAGVHVEVDSDPGSSTLPGSAKETHVSVDHGPDDIPIAALRRQQALVVVEKRGKRLPTPPGTSHDRCEEPNASQREPRMLTKTFIKWSCRTCRRECIPIREESRCLCGHRYKEHPSSASDPRVKNPKGFRAFACTSAKCSCPSFFYIVAEGAWVLRCRCKHKHIDHDASRGAPFACKKPKCSCTDFDSPWICNCNHPWSEHAQEVVTKQIQHPLDLLEHLGNLSDLTTVERTDLIAEPLQLRL